MINEVIILNSLTFVKILYFKFNDVITYFTVKIAILSILKL